MESQASQSAAGTVQADEIRFKMRRVQKHQWWLWSSAVAVILLLTLGIASFVFPGLLKQEETFYSFYLNQAVRGLVGAVLLFSVYTVYQQHQIHQIQRRLAEQVDTMGKMELRTEEVYHLAVLDPLTGLYNRRSGELRLTEEISRSQRHGCPLTVILLDLNDLKHVNDELGHPAGDELLKCFAQRLTRAIRGSDVAVRLGGDEFLLLLPECKLEDVEHVLSRLTGFKMEYAGRTIPLTFSAGWTNYVSGELLEQLLKRADDALYVNKRAQKQQGEPTSVR